MLRRQGSPRSATAGFALFKVDFMVTIEGQLTFHGAKSLLARREASKAWIDACEYLSRCSFQYTRSKPFVFEYSTRSFVGLSAKILACEQALIFVVKKDVARAAKPRVTSRRAQRAGEISENSRRLAALADS